MTFLIRIINNAWVALLLGVTCLPACKYDGNPNDLPGVSTGDYQGKIDGYNNSEEIFPEKMVAYWSFDDTKAELKSGKTPTRTLNDAFITGGVRGKAISLTGGYLYYATQFNAFKTDSLKSFTISCWIQILNNGTKRTMLMQLARPGMFTGNLSYNLNTQSFPASNTDVLRIQPIFQTVGGGTQDNLNSTLSPKIGMTKWTHLVLTYNGTTGVFDIWADAVKVGQFPNRGTGNNLFKAYEPTEFIIGGNYNIVLTPPLTADVSYAAMTGNIDELRIYNLTMPDAHIRALYNLGVAGK